MAAAAGQPPPVPQNLVNAFDRYNQFAEGAYIWKQSDKSLGWERAKMAASIILGLGAIATILLMPYIQNHTFQDFGHNLLKGLEEAKWAILAGSVTALGVGALFGLYVWRKNNEERNESQIISDFDEFPNDEERNISQAEIDKAKEKTNDLSVNKWTIAITLAALLAIGAAAYSSWHYQAWNFDDLSRIHNDIIMAGAVSIVVMSIAYGIFKNKEINELKVNKSVVETIQQDDIDDLGDYEFSILINETKGTLSRVAGQKA